MGNDEHLSFQGDLHTAQMRDACSTCNPPFPDPRVCSTTPHSACIVQAGHCADTGKRRDAFQHAATSPRVLCTPHARGPLQAQVLASCCTQ